MRADDRADALGVRMETGETMKRFPIPMYIYIGTAMLAFAWRFVTIPWDFGGFFYQCWVAVVGAALFGALYPRLSKTGRLLAASALLPIGALLLFGSVYFAPQALFPFMFVAFALGGALFLWSQSKKSQTLLVSLLLIPLGAYCLYGLDHMALMVRLRSLHPEDVAELRFTSVSDDSGEIVVSRSDAVESIVRSLRHTSPYGPNHEGIESPWRVTMAMRDGSSIGFRLGNGNRDHPSFVWIQFGVEVYQNAELREALRTAGVELWPLDPRS